MNDYMDSYITSCITYLKTFQTSLRMAALKKDGYIDKGEQKVLDKANKATDKCIRDLEGLIGK